MRPKQFLDEATTELETLLKHSLIDLRQFFIRLSFVKIRYYQKVALRESYARW